MTCKKCESEDTEIKYFETLGLGCQPDDPPLMPYEVCKDCGHEELIEDEI